MNLFKKNYFRAFILLFLFSVSFAGSALAESKDDINVSALESVGCFDEGLYKFPSVKVVGGPEMRENEAGKDVLIRGEIQNENSYPVVDGNLFVRISRDNPNYKQEGYNILEEVVALENVVIDASSTIPFQFVWKAPLGLVAGDYRIDYFFSVGKKFNLGGLPFTNEIIAGASNFVIKSPASLVFSLDKAGTKVNDLKYVHIGNWTSVKSGEKVLFSQPLKNYSNREIVVDVEYSLYFWDSLNEKDLINKKAETVTVPANSVVNLNYSVDKVVESDYYLKIKAGSAGVSSIVNVRVISDIADARLNYPAITKFPLASGQEFKVFTCYHNTGGVTPEASVKLKLSDEDGKVVYTGAYQGDIYSDMSAVASKIVSERDYTYLKLDAEIINKAGDIVDSYTAIYDCSVLKSQACADLNHKIVWGDVFVYFITLLVVAVISFVLSLLLSNHPTLKKVLKNLSAVVVLLIVVLVIAFYVANAKLLSAQNYARDSTNYREQISVDAFSIGYSFKDGSGDGWGNRHTGYVNSYRITRGQLAGSRNIQVGQDFYIYTSYDCMFDHIGGHWDTPYCGTVSTIDLGNEGKINIVDPGYTTSIAFNSNVLSCVKQSNPNYYKCTAIAPGTSGVQLTVPAVSTSFSSCAEVSKEAGGVIVTTNNTTNTSPQCKQHGGPATYTYIGRKVSETSPSYSSTSLGINFAKHEMYWDITVTGGGNVVATCSDRIQNQNETGIDRGGVCENHSGGGNCHDGIKNGNETAVDIGGSCALQPGGSVNGECIAPRPYEYTPTYWCERGSVSGWLQSGSNPVSWSWTCNGIGSGSQNVSCTASLEPTPPPPARSLPCSISMVDKPANNRVAVNTNTVWKVLGSNGEELSSSYVRNWTISSSGQNQTASGQSLNQIFTTVGQKTIDVSLSVTDDAGRVTAFNCGADSAVTTSVVLPGDLNEI